MTGEGVPCAGCGDGWTAHEEPAGPCAAVDDDGRCPCAGFRWLDPVPERELRRLAILAELRQHQARPRRRGRRAPLAPGRVR
jgi:hypothetical protein